MKKIRKAWQINVMGVSLADGDGGGCCCGDQILGQVQQNTAQCQQLETAYQQTCRAIAALYEFAPPEEGRKPRPLTRTAKWCRRKEGLVCGSTR